MRIRFRSDFSATRGKLVRAKGAVRMSFGGEMKRAARLVAVSLAKETVPFGDGPEDKRVGEIATARDIRKVYARPSKVYAAFENKKQANVFYALLKQGKIALAQEIVDKHCPEYRGVPIGEFDLFLHQGARNRRGRIPDRRHYKPLQIVINPKALDDYIKAEVKLVGWGKAGWAAACRALELPTRGIPQWVTRHKAPGAVADGTRSGDKPFIILFNNVGYAQLILTESSKNEAVRIGLDRYFRDRRVTAVVRDALRKELT